MTKTYRPLPESLTIKESEIEGLGLFATEEIQELEYLGITHVFNHKFEDSMIRTPLGGFINHSENPNCIIKRDAGAGFVLEVNMLHTIRDIKPGEELTVTYTTYKV